MIHLVAKIGEASSEEREMNNESTSNSNSRRGENLAYGIMNRILRTEGLRNASLGEGLNNNFNNLFSTTNNSTSINSGTNTHPFMGRRTRRREEAVSSQQTSDFNAIEAKETISQNLATIENLISGMNNANSNESGLPNEIMPLTGRRFVIGQWVDVKDTIDQWLEAQVINVRDNQVYVHYNGWGTRWDEWIDMSSDRIMPFRYHTRQSSFHNFNSPYPNVRPDANVNYNTSNTVSSNFFDIFNKLNGVMNITNSLISKINTKRAESRNNISSNNNPIQREIFTYSKQLAPILDKFGRTLTDVGAYINYDLRNNKCDDLDQELFNNIDENLKPYTPEEQSVVNEEALANSNPRGNRHNNANVIPPVNRLDKQIANQVPVMDSPLVIYNRAINNTPSIDIYVHTFVTPTRETSTNSTTQPNVINNIISNAVESNQIPTNTSTATEGTNTNVNNIEETSIREDNGDSNVNTNPVNPPDNNINNFDTPSSPNRKTENEFVGRKRLKRKSKDKKESSEDDVEAKALNKRTRKR